MQYLQYFCLAKLECKDLKSTLRVFLFKYSMTLNSPICANSVITIEVWKKILSALISLNYLSNTEMVGSDFLCKQHDTMDLSCFVSVVQVLLAVCWWWGYFQPT